MRSARTQQGMLSPPVGQFAVPQHGILDLTGSSWGQEKMRQGTPEVAVTRREYLPDLMSGFARCFEVQAFHASAFLLFARLLREQFLSIKSAQGIWHASFFLTLVR